MNEHDRLYVESLRKQLDDARASLDHRTLSMGAAIKRAEQAEQKLARFEAAVSSIGEGDAAEALKALGKLKEHLSEGGTEDDRPRREGRVFRLDYRRDGIEPVTTEVMYHDTKRAGDMMTAALEAAFDKKEPK